MTSEEWDCNGFLGSFTENIVLWKHERYLLTPLPTATYIAQGWDVFPACMQVPQMNFSCFELNRTLQSYSVYFSSKFMLFIVYSFAFNRASIGLELQSETVVILET